MPSPIKVNVKADIRELTREFNRVRDPRPAIARALNRTGQTVKANSARIIRDEGYNIKIGDIKKAIAMKLANQSELVVVLRALGRPIPLFKYGAKAVKGKGGGVSVQVKNGRKLIRGAFIATMPNGHTGVFVRVGSAAHAAGLGRHGIIRRGGNQKHGLPIDELFGPSIPAAFLNNVVQTDMAATARTRFPIELRRELAFRSRGAR